MSDHPETIPRRVEVWLTYHEKLSARGQEKESETARLIRDMATALATVQREREEAKEQIEALRAAFAAFGDQLQQFTASAENEWREWGHQRYAILGAVAVLTGTARKYAVGQPAYVPTYKKRAEAAEARCAALVAYVKHRPGCASGWRAATGSSQMGPCDCGLATAMASAGNL